MSGGRRGGGIGREEVLLVRGELVSLAVVGAVELDTAVLARVALHLRVG